MHGSQEPFLMAAAMSNTPEPRLVYLTAHSIAVGRLLIGQLAYFRERGYEVVAVARPIFKKL